MNFSAPTQALRDLFETAALPDTACAEVTRRMSAEGRHYHDLAHLEVLWARNRQFTAGTEFSTPSRLRLIACAVAFHDVVFDTTRDDNEHVSATVWRSMAPNGLTPSDIDWVAETIEATADHLQPVETDSAGGRLRLWMLDLDLTPLGEAPEVFAYNTLALRAEYAHLSESEWDRHRLCFLHKLDTAPVIYRCPAFHAVFEQPARRNIAADLAR